MNFRNRPRYADLICIADQGCYGRCLIADTSVVLNLDQFSVEMTPKSIWARKYSDFLCALFDKATKNAKFKPIVQDTTTLLHFIRYIQYRPHGNDLYAIVSTAEKPPYITIFLLDSLSSSLEHLLNSSISSLVCSIDSCCPRLIRFIQYLDLYSRPDPDPVMLLQESQYGLHSFECRLIRYYWSPGIWISQFLFLHFPFVEPRFTGILFPDWGKSTYDDRLLAVLSPLCSP